MSSEFRERVREKVKEIQQEVYIKDDILEKIVGLFLSLKEGRFPSRKPPRGILFYGPPGTGKTLLMKTLARKLKLSEPIIIRGPEIISQYYGKSEYRLRQRFDLAKERAEEENLAIIFIDEIDSIAPRRDLTRGELEPRLVGQLLSLMDGLE
ncbi:MAG: AAA family ATPase, partial [Candidatus Aenigmatarchaeota archaeon]